jgi:hypothetical protein
VPLVALCRRILGRVSAHLETCRFSGTHASLQVQLSHPIRTADPKQSDKGITLIATRQRTTKCAEVLGFAGLPTSLFAYHLYKILYAKTVTAQPKRPAAIDWRGDALDVLSSWPSEVKQTLGLISARYRTVKSPVAGVL